MAGPMCFLTKLFVKNARSVLYVTDSFLQKRYPSKTTQQIGCSDVELTIEKGILNKRLSKIKELNRINSKIKLGMIGFIEAKYKGFDTAIEALDILKKNGHDNYILEIVGGGDATYIKNLVADYDLKDQVKIIGGLSHPKGIFEWLDAIDIYMQPSKTEGLPRALIEAMSRACACIGSDSGEIPELLDSNYIHKKNDAIRMANILIELRHEENMKKNAKDCYMNAQKYDKKLLDYNRNLFYKKSMRY